MAGRTPVAMVLPFGKAYRLIHGGGYHHRPTNMFGVKMAKEINAPCDVDIPTVDFSIPPEQAMRDGIKKTLWQITLNKPVLVGCYGGIGRTGLFLGVLVRVLGEKDPVKYVREHYYAHAIETQQQQDFVNNMPLGNLPILAKGAKLIARVYDYL